MSTLLLDTGIIPYSSVKREVSKFAEENSLYVINHPDARWTGWDSAPATVGKLCYCDLDAVAPLHRDRSGNDDCYERVLAALLADVRTVILAERVYGRRGWQSTFQHIQLVEKQAVNCLNLLLEIRPDTVHFQATPHHVRQWVLAKTAEALGIRVQMFQTSPLPWRFWLVEGVDEQRVVMEPLRTNEHLSDAEHELLEGFLLLNSSSYGDAIPEYERRRFASRGGRIWSWKRELLESAKHPRLWPSVVNQRRLLLSYEELAQAPPDNGQPNVVVFLHYQPERTSLPEGGQYGQQWLMIRSLSMAIPEHWILYVKEHPSTFMGKYRRAYRSPSFYSDISDLHNVKLVPAQADTFRLIDRTNAVATITGTVGVQALIRGKPVLAFGCASYREALGAFRVGDSRSVRSALREAESLTANGIKSAFRRFLLQCTTRSLNGRLDLEAGRPADLDRPFHDSDSRIQGHVRLLKMILGRH